jgi:flagellar biosynthesis protein FlhA
LVTRVSADDHTLGENIGIQMFSNPKIMGIMGVLLLLMGAIPGLPNLPFLAFGAMGAGASFLLWKRDKKEASDIADAEAVEDASKLKKKSAENVMDLLTVEALELEIGYRLVPLIEAEAGGDLLQRITQIRRQMATELGFVLPSIRVRDNLQLPPNTYHIKLKGITLESGEVMSDLWLAMSTDPEVTEPLEGIQTKEPAFGLPATWVYDDQRELAEVSGYTVVSPAAVVATHISEVIKRKAADILNRSDVNELLENVKKTAEPLVSDIIPDPLTAAELHLILQNLLRERVNIRDLPSILEALGYHCRVSKDADYLTEQSRMALSRSIWTR